MASYTIIGGDGKEYGPVTEADVRQWAAEGRINAQSLAKGEGDAEFRPLAQFPELAGLFAPAAPATIAPVRGAGADGWSCDYELDLGGCIARGWNLVKDHMSPLFVGALVYLLIECAVGGLSNIPFVGPVFSIANFICSGPLIGGLFYMFIRVNRGEPAEIGDLFSGFRRAFGQLFLGVLVPGLLIGLCAAPFVIVFVIKLIPVLGQLQHSGQTPGPEVVNAIKSALLTALPVMLVCLVPVTYLSICWKFTLPLIIDKGLDFGAAMKLSWKKVNQHWWQVFGLIVLIGLLNLAGICACCVGLLFTIPVGFAALMSAYETIFGEKN